MYVMYTKYGGPPMTILLTLGMARNMIWLFQEQIISCYDNNLEIPYNPEQ